MLSEQMFINKCVLYFMHMYCTTFELFFPILVPSSFLITVPLVKCTGCHLDWLFSHIQGGCDQLYSNLAPCWRLLFGRTGLVATFRCQGGLGEFPFPLPPVSLSLWLCSLFVNMLSIFPVSRILFQKSDVLSMPFRWRRLTTVNSFKVFHTEHIILPIVPEA